MNDKGKAPALSYRDKTQRLFDIIHRGRELADEHSYLSDEMDRYQLAPWAEEYCKQRTKELVKELEKMAGITAEEREAFHEAIEDQLLQQEIDEFVSNSSEYVREPNGNIRKVSLQ